MSAEEYLSDARIVDEIEKIVRHHAGHATGALSLYDLFAQLNKILDRRVPRDVYNKTHGNPSDPMGDLLQERQT